MFPNPLIALSGSVTFRAMRFASLYAALTFLVLCLQSGAQIIEIRNEGEKTFTCARSGLFSDSRDCGAPSWYEYVFVGSITSITPADGDEKDLQVMPEEIFKGNPPSPLKVRTSQAKCFPKIAPGDRWLFFLRKATPVLFDYYGGDSIPVESAQEKIETLRRLGTLKEEGLVRGSVVRRGHGDEITVPHAQVVLKRFPDDLRFFAVTDAHGRYEFQPIPAGRYKITVDPVGSFQPDSGTVNVDSGRCWDLTLSRYPHARISGHVLRSNGSPAVGVPILFLQEGDAGYSSSRTDQRGKFEFAGLESGKYVVGISFSDAPPWKDKTCGGACGAVAASMYYPGTLSRSDASSINLATDEKCDDIDFTLPY